MRKVLYASSGPYGCNGGSEDWTSSPTESEMGGIISAWNMSVVGSSASSAMTLAMSVEETAGNSATPLSIKKPLKPRTPSLTKDLSSPTLPGIMPP